MGKTDKTDSSLASSLNSGEMKRSSEKIVYKQTKYTKVLNTRKNVIYFDI